MKDFATVFQRPKGMRLYIIHTGNVHMNGNIHFNKKSPLFPTKPIDTRFNPVYCYLIEHPKHGFCLIDTGIHSDFVTNKIGNFGPLVGKIIQVKTQKGMDVLSQIASIGLGVKDIRHIVMTHLHPDHSSGLPLLKDSGCMIYTDYKELKTASSPLGMMNGYLKKHWQGFQIEFFKYNLTIPSFDKVADLFGDESIFVISTYGHTEGNVSILLNMEGGPVLLTGDAAHRRDNLMSRIPTKGDYSTGLISINQLADFVEANPLINVLYSHDPQQFNELKLFPEYYE